MKIQHFSKVRFQRNKCDKSDFLQKEYVNSEKES